jgi:glc operon protein GlcG
MKHRIMCLGLAVAAVIAVSGLAFAQTVPPQFVVTGKTAEKIHDFNEINLATAQRIVETCERLVTAHGGGEHSIIVLDHNGNRVYMDRMDGQGYTNIITPEMKARTALITRAPSKIIQNLVERDPSMEPYEVQLGLYPVAGGLPIIINHQLIGAVGGGGYRPNPPVWDDEICVHKSLVQVFGPSIPPLLEDVRPETIGSRGTLPVPSFGVTKPPKSTLPAKFVVTGAGAAHVFDGDQISLAAAKKIALGCRAWATSKNKTMTAYVLNTAGEMVHMERMDGQGSLPVRTALLKAQTALRLREPTSIRGTQLLNTRRGVARDMSPNIFHFYLGSGGIPIVVDGQMIGAVGVSGVEGGQDEQCAIEGLKAAFGNRATLPVYEAASTAGGAAAAQQR